MTKAERRKRARARAREREKEAAPPDALEKAVEAVQAAPAVAPAPAEPESEFITGPVVARDAERRPMRTTAPRPVAGARQSVQPDDDEDDIDDADEDDDDDLLAGADEDDDGEDDDEELDAQEDALFNLACAAIEEDEELSWQETASLLMTAEVTDPRLALLIGLIMEGAPEDEEGERVKPHVPLPLTGKRVLAMLGELSLGELVEEAREVTELSPNGREDAEDERMLVRTNARELNQQSKRELAQNAKVSRDPSRPLRASEIKGRTALSSGALGSRRGG